MPISTIPPTPSRRPLLWILLTAIIGFPSWASGTWGFFSSEPLFVVLQRIVDKSSFTVDVSFLSPTWTNITITSALFIWLGVDIYLQQRKTPTKHNADSSTEFVTHKPVIAGVHEGRRKMRESAEGVQILPPKYLPPPEAAAEDIGAESFEQLGERMVALGNEVSKLVTSNYRANDTQIRAAFLERYARRFFWLYQEVSNRGISDPQLGRWYQNPSSIYGISEVRELAKCLNKFGTLVKVYV